MDSLFESFCNENLPDKDLAYYEHDGSFVLFGDNATSLHHVNYATFGAAFRQLEDTMKKTSSELVILETGMSRNCMNSTHFFNEIIRKYGGRFWSVDIDLFAVEIAKLSVNPCPGTTLVHDDSVNFLRTWARDNSGTIPSLVYLDSYDVDWLDPLPAAQHGMAEYYAILPACQPGYTIILVDDTPVSPAWLPFRDGSYDIVSGQYEQGVQMPGKGMQIVNAVDNDKVIMHQYQFLFRV